MLDLTSLEKALFQLERTYHVSQKEPDAEKAEMLKTACVQCFEYTYELSQKMLARQLENMEASPDNIKHLTYKDFIRISAQKNLIDDPKIWFDFREKRNITSHTYNQDKAEEIYQILPQFISKVKYILKQLKLYNKQDN